MFRLPSDPVDDTTVLRNLRPPRRSLRRLRLAALGAAAALALSACGPELGPIARLASIDRPTLPETSDPSVVRTGSTYFVFGSNNHLRAPVTVTDDIDRVYTLGEKNEITREAMPTRPAWAAASEQLWAPTVGMIGGRWLMYFAADRRNPPQPDNAQCIGRAVATAPEGPYEPEPTPLYCGLGGRGGALDPELFRDEDGRWYLLAALSDTEEPLRTFRLSASGGLSGPPVTILPRQFPWEYHFIEQPAMTYDATRGTYLLAYSAGRWWEPRYSTGIARCTGPLGPCTSDPEGPWVASSNGRTGSGGLSFFEDTAGRTRAIFATFAAGQETTVGGRSATVMPLTLQPAVGLGEVVK